MTQPVAHAPAPPAAPAVYPRIDMPRLDAAYDLSAVVGLILAFFFLGDTGVVALFIRAVPALGALGANIMLGLMSLSLIAFILFWRHQTGAAIGLNRPPPHLLLAWTAGAVVAVIIAAYSTGFLYVLIQFAIDPSSVERTLSERSDFIESIPDIGVIHRLVFTLFIGIHEEVLFRGLVLSRLRALWRSDVAAVLISALLFGLMHFTQGPAAMVQTGAIGGVLAILVFLTRSLWPAILAHAAFDFIQLSIIPLLGKLITENAPQLQTTMPAG